MLYRRQSLRLIAATIASISATAFAQAPAPAPTPAPEAPTAQPQPTLQPAPEAAPAPAPAAAPAAEEVAPKKRKSEGETIVVTGSRIRRKDLTTPAPITLIGKEQMQDSGRVSLGDFLQTLPEQGNAPNTNVNNGGDGSTRISLRGLGPERTLVLVNGRRWVSGGTGADPSVDLNSIPAAAIDHIEVLKDGASAVYGSDAIAGVVNIITKKHFDGSEANAYVGTSGHGDGTQYSIDATTGTSGDRGSILFSANYFQQYPIFAGDRHGMYDPQIYYDGSPGGLGQVPSGSSSIPAGRIWAFQKGVTVPGATLFNTLVTQYPTANSFIFDPSATNSWRPFKGSSLAKDGYDYQTVNYLTTPQQRFGLFSTGEAKLGSAARAYFEASFSNRQSSQQLAPEPLVLGPGGTPIKISAQSVTNPFGVDVYARMRLLNFGPRIFIQDFDTFRFLAGLDGTLPEEAGPLAGWFWDLSLNYGRMEGTQQQLGDLRTNRIASAIGPSFNDPLNGPTCGTPASPIGGGCVPLDLLHGPGGVTQAAKNYLSFDGVLRAVNALTTAQANTSGELFHLAASRPVGLALGYEYRFAAGASIPDPITASGENSDNNNQPTAGHYYSNEGYAELSIPVVDGLPGIDDLELTAAVRLYNYNVFGGGVTYKLGGMYRPVPGFSVRGTYSTAFRAPSVSDLYLGQADSFENVTDPCAGATAPASCGPAKGNGDVSTQLRASVGGNPNLKPETAQTVTAGLVLEPGVMFDAAAIKRLSLTVDYYNISISQSISSLGANTILSGCYPSSTTQAPQYCSLITRDPTSQFITRIIDINQNVGSLATQGMDVGLNYNLPTSAGRFNFLADATYLFQIDQTLANGQIIHGKNTWDLNTGGYGGVYPALKGLASITWGLGGFGAGLIGHFIGPIQECGDPGGQGFYSGAGLCYQDSTYQRAVSPYGTVDLFLSYALKTNIGKTTFMLGMNNIADQNAPFIYNAFAPNTDPQSYDLVGRFFYARVGHTF